MKAIRFLFLLLLFSCSEEEPERPIEIEINLAEAAQLEYPVRNSMCTEGENSEGAYTEIEFRWKQGNYTTSHTLGVVNLLTKAETNYTTKNTSYKVKLERGTPYSWWIISYNTDIPEGTKSLPAKFYTSGDGITNYAPFAADLIMPENGSKFPDTTTSVQFEWQAADVDGEDLTFELYISRKHDFLEGIKIDLTQNLFEFQVDNEVEYFWKVLARDPMGNVSESDVSVFEVLGKEQEEDNSGKSSEKKILSFNIEHDGVIYAGNIDHEAKTILLELDNFDYRSLAPVIESSEASRVIPASGTNQNFLDDLYYTVIAEDDSELTYDIIVLSGQNEILDFEVHHEGSRYIGIVDAENATVTIDLGGLDFSAMETYIKTSNRSTIDPPGGVAQNFNQDVFYTVTSERGTTKTFKVMAPIRLKETFPFYAYGVSGYKFTEETLDDRFVLYAGADLNFKAINFPDPEKVKIEIVSDEGTSYPLDIYKYKYYHENHMEISYTEYEINTIIPFSIPSGIYTYRIFDGIKETHYGHKLEVINDATAIRINSINSQEFSYQDTIVLKGKNLTKTFFIYSDFSYYTFNEYSNNTYLSEDRAELKIEINQNTPGALSGGNPVKPLVFYTFLEGYEHPVLSNTVYFTFKNNW